MLVPHALGDPICMFSIWCFGLSYSVFPSKHDYPLVSVSDVPEMPIIDWVNYQTHH